VAHNTPKSKLEKLRLLRDAKFDEIVSCLSEELYASFDEKRIASPARQRAAQRLDMEKPARAPISGGGTWLSHRLRHCLCRSSSQNSLKDAERIARMLFAHASMRCSPRRAACLV
jgi:hypothetical protein